MSIAPNPPDEWLAIDPEKQRAIDARAIQWSANDAALFFHYQAILEGAYRIRCRSEKDYQSWNCVKVLPQYGDVETSVIEGWRIFVRNTSKIRNEEQRDLYAVNCALILDALSRKRDPEQVRDLLKRRARTIALAAQKGDAEFFRRMGRRLGEKKTHSLAEFDYARMLLSQWLTGFLWLMPERTASECLARWLGCKDSMRHFNAAKHEGYKLKSHKPSLINHIQADGALVLTMEGRRLLNPRARK